MIVVFLVVTVIMVVVKDFLKSEKLPDPRPLIYVCDLHGYIEELTTYLHANQLMKYIEVYVTKVNPLNCPKVVGALLDLDSSEDFVKNLLQSVLRRGTLGGHLRPSATRGGRAQVSPARLQKD